MEAVEDKTGTIMIEDSPKGNYAKNFKSGYREQFVKNQKVRVAKRENLKGCNKYSKRGFLDLGKIVEICPGDSYVVRLENGRYF